MPWLVHALRAFSGAALVAEFAARLSTAADLPEDPDFAANAEQCGPACQTTSGRVGALVAPACCACATLVGVVTERVPPKSPVRGSCFVFVSCAVNAQNSRSP